MSHNKLLSIFGVHVKPFKYSTCPNFRMGNYSDNKLGLQVKEKYNKLLTNSKGNLVAAAYLMRLKLCNIQNRHVS